MGLGHRVCVLSSTLASGCDYASGETTRLACACFSSGPVQKRNARWRRGGEISGQEELAGEPCSYQGD